MKNLLIIYPHWPPSNLAGVHRPRLIGNFIAEFGWKPIVLTVDPKYYEEAHDPDMAKTVSPDIEVHFVNAFERLGPVGDIALRGFWQLYSGALKLIKTTKIDFIWIPIPAYYAALLGRLIHERTGIPYGIDYIDPWVDGIIGCEKKWSKSWWSNRLAKVMEPFALKKASLITGVSEPYYSPSIRRNFQNRHITHRAMPYGFDPSDHRLQLSGFSLPWADEPAGTQVLVYAGAFLPKSGLFVQKMFEAFAELSHRNEKYSKVKFYFLGTGHYPQKSILEYAQEAGVLHAVTEIRDRFPFLHILQYLSQAHAVMVIGSTEQHYTASKTFQSLLSHRPVVAMLHAQSSAVTVLEECRADDYTFKYTDGTPDEAIKNEMSAIFEKLLNIPAPEWQPDLSGLDKYSARHSARILAQGLDEALSKRNSAVNF